MPFSGRCIDVDVISASDMSSVVGSCRSRRRILCWQTEDAPEISKPDYVVVKNPPVESVVGWSDHMKTLHPSVSIEVSKAYSKIERQ